jgi:hypothetical protein
MALAMITGQKSAVANTVQMGRKTEQGGKDDDTAREAVQAAQRSAAQLTPP